MVLLLSPWHHCIPLSRSLSRKRISKEEIPEVKSVIRKLEMAWDQKWADCLKRTPLTSFLNEDPVSAS